MRFLLSAFQGRGGFTLQDVAAFTYGFSKYIYATWEGLQGKTVDEQDIDV